MSCGQFWWLFLVCFWQAMLPGRAGGEGSPVFVNVAKEAGLHFRHETGASGHYYTPEINGAGLAAFDYDNDGWVDLYAVNGASLPGFTASGPAPVNALYRNRGDGAFEDATALARVGDTGYGMAAVAADYDNDGDLDLYVSNYGANVLYRNRGDGTFEDVTATARVGDTGWGGGCAFADYDSDGDLDLYVANYVRYRPGDEPREFVPYVAMSMREKVGTVKAYAGPKNFEAAPNVLYRNEGDGHFVEVAAEAGVDDPTGRDMGVVFADYDNDGDPDLFVADDEGGNSLFRNDGPWPGGRFVDVGLFSGVAYDGDGNAQATMGVAFGDYDNDGRFDLATTSFQGEPFALYHNEGDGFFADVSMASQTALATLPMLGWGVCFLDYDNDGDLDLFFANGHAQDGVERLDPSTTTAQANALFENRGNGTFADVSVRSGPGLAVQAQSRGSVCLDYDNDGDLDLAILNKRSLSPADGGGIDLLRNDGGNRRHWLMLKLAGKTGGVNRDGVGARVTVWADGRMQVREVQCGDSYQSQSDLRIHVGLNQQVQADSVRIRWPGGRRQMLYGIGANQVVRVVEPE